MTRKGILYRKEVLTMMRYMKIGSAICVFVVLMVLLGTRLLEHGSGYTSVQYASESAMGYFETTLEGLEKRAPNIIKARPIDNSGAVFYMLDDTPDSTLREMEIIDVFQGDLKPGEIIKIMEPYCIVGRTLYVRRNYLPSKQNQEYIFFLSDASVRFNPERKNAEAAIGAFLPAHGERSRYPITSDGRMKANDYSREELSLGKGNTDLYMRLYQEVIDAYMK